MDMRWNLNDLYTSFDAPAYKRDFARFRELVAELSAWAKQNLTDSDNAAGKIEAYIQHQTELARLTLMLHYASLVMSVDT